MINDVIWFGSLNLTNIDLIKSFNNFVDVFLFCRLWSLLHVKIELIGFALKLKVLFEFLGTTGQCEVYIVGVKCQNFLELGFE